MAGTADTVRAFVFLSLLVYFGLRIRASTSKFYEGRISTSAETRHARYLLYPSFTICPIMPSNWSGGTYINGVLGGNSIGIFLISGHFLGPFLSQFKFVGGLKKLRHMSS